jgi:hypothetical protein
MEYAANGLEARAIIMPVVRNEHIVFLSPIIIQVSGQGLIFGLLKFHNSHGITQL